MTQGSFSSQALEAYEALIADTFSLDFSEDQVYDFTRCVRPDGSSYGSRGKCRKGTEQAKEGRQRPAMIYGKEETPSEREEQVKKVKAWAEAEKASQAKSEAFKKKTRKMAEELFAKTGAEIDGSTRTENLIEGIRNDILRITDYARPTESRRLVAAGDLEGLLSHAKKVVDGGQKAHIKSAVEEERKRINAERAKLKMDKKKEGASEEETARALSDQEYYHNREMARVKIAAEREWNALFSVLRAVR
jgi:hypothetical protein